ncbi:MAG: rhodanese-like domain-containing protein [Anaerolineae bacterium]
MGRTLPGAGAAGTGAGALTLISLSRTSASLVRGISAAEVKEMMDKGEDFVLLDVRSPQEYEQMRIEDPRVKLIPLGRLHSRLSELPQDKLIVAFCRVSLRGYEAARALSGAGFNDVRLMDGGLVAWPYELHKA